MVTLPHTPPMKMTTNYGPTEATPTEATASTPVKADAGDQRQKPYAAMCGGRETKVPRQAGPC